MSVRGEAEGWREATRLALVDVDVRAELVGRLREGLERSELLALVAELATNLPLGEVLQALEDAHPGTCRGSFSVKTGERSYQRGSFWPAVTMPASAGSGLSHVAEVTGALFDYLDQDGDGPMLYGGQGGAGGALVLLDRNTGEPILDTVAEVNASGGEGEACSACSSEAGRSSATHAGAPSWGRSQASSRGPGEAISTWADPSGHPCPAAHTGELGAHLVRLRLGACARRSPG